MAVIAVKKKARQNNPFEGGLVLLHCSPDGSFIQWENNGPLGVPGGEQLARGAYNVEPVGAKKYPKKSKMEPLGILGTPWGGLVGP